MSVTALVLAAGASSRMRGDDKLLREIDGEALLRRTARTALASRADETLVVLGARAGERAAALEGLALRQVVNPDWQDGMGGSIAAGAGALPAGTGGVLILLADMPDIDSALLDRMIGAADGESDAIIVPEDRNGRRGNPVLFGSTHFAALRALTGDSGAKSVIAGNPRFLRTVRASAAAISTDLDTPEEWVNWSAKRGT